MKLHRSTSTTTYNPPHDVIRALGVLLACLTAGVNMSGSAWASD
ncbi:MAG: hypothetical protein ACI81O_001448, partial [Cyclobacteriaceae bacterium]